MSNAIERLNKIIALEIKQGYRNKSVIGGFGRLATRWGDDAAAEVASDYQRALLQHIIGQLTALR